MSYKIEAKGDCIGLRFRAVRNYYYSKESFVETRTFRLLKKQSCDGCKECGGAWEFVKELATEIDELPLASGEVFDAFKDYGVRIDPDGDDFCFYVVGDNKFK